MNLTQEEIKLFETASTDDEWNAACQIIKGARGGDYPPDWYEKAIKPGGLINQYQARTSQEVGDGFHITQL